MTINFNMIRVKEGKKGEVPTLSAKTSWREKKKKKARTKMTEI